jgi:hypothetical protein
MNKIELKFKFCGIDLSVGGYMFPGYAVSLLYVDVTCPKETAKLLSIKPLRGSLLTDIEYEAREVWARMGSAEAKEFNRAAG